MPATRSKHSPLYSPFIWAALGLALTGGFGYAAALVGGPRLGWPVGNIWLPLVQAHGHLQLFGWAGLLVVAVGLYFLPRLRGTPLAAQHLTPWPGALLAAGLVLRMVCQPALGLLWPGPAASLATLGFVLSGVLALAGVSLFVAMLLATGRSGRPLVDRPGLVPVAPYLVVSFACFWLVAAANAWLVASSTLPTPGVAGPPGSLPLAWDGLLVHLTLAGFLVPIALAFSVRTFPLFLTLAPPPHDQLLPVLLVYTTGLALRLAGGAAQALGTAPGVAGRAAGLGGILEGVALLAFTWLLDVLFRRRQAWTTGRRILPQAEPAGPGRRPTRGLLPDYGEYGRFEWLLVPSYVWLAVAAGLMLVNGGAVLLGMSPPIPPDAERHALAVGFITLLILGMAARMLPGFAGRKPARPRLVDASAMLGNAAAVLRVVPLLLAPLVDTAAAAGPVRSLGVGVGAVLGSGYEISGLVGWAAVACLAVNLWWTLRSGGREGFPNM